MTKEDLRFNIIESLTSQGFSVNGHVTPTFSNKAHFRKIQTHSRKEQLSIHSDFIQNSYDTISKYLINGNQINPAQIDLELREVKRDSKEETIFRWWNFIWWSVPYQRAYGRQMRFLLWDKFHNAPFGLIGLQSPILKMSVRDNYLQIPNNKLDIWINRSLQAQRLGALPPYNQLLGGKMVAMSLTANELREVYKNKYSGIETLMEKRVIDSDLLFLTTTSAFGRSSIYNRLKYKNDLVAESLGFTKGSGTFHISEKLYLDIIKYLIRNDVNVSRSFGNGPSRKIKLLEKALGMLKLSEYTYHNILREFFLFPLVNNLKGVITQNIQPEYYDRKLSDLVDFWKERWCVPRSNRFNDWKVFDGKKFLISTKRNITRWSK